MLVIGLNFQRCSSLERNGPNVPAKNIAGMHGIRVLPPVTVDQALIKKPSALPAHLAKSMSVPNYSIIIVLPINVQGKVSRYTPIGLIIYRTDKHIVEHFEVFSVDNPQFEIPQKH